MTDKLHDLLTTEGERWRDGLGPDPDLAGMVDRPPRRGWALPAFLAAAVVLAVVALGAGLASIVGGHSSGVAARPAHCQDDFTVAPTRFADTARGQLLALRLTYTGAAPCSIDGLGPHVDLLDAAGHVLGRGEDTSLVYRPNLTVEPGDVVAFALTLDGICPRPDRPVATVRLHMDGNIAAGTAGIDVPTPGATVPSCPSGAQSPDVIMGFGFPEVVHSPSANRLLPRERAFALRIARHAAGGRLAAAREPGNPWSSRGISIVTAMIRPGTVTDHNIGRACASGRLLVVQLIGDFPDVVTANPGGLPGSSEPADPGVHELDYTVDARSGVPCLLSVRTGAVHPSPGATVLYQR